MLAFLLDDAKDITKARKTLASLLIISQICFAKSQNSDCPCFCPKATETTTKNSLPRKILKEGFNNMGKKKSRKSVRWSAVPDAPKLVCMGKRWLEG